MMKPQFNTLSAKEILRKVTEQGFLIDLYGGHQENIPLTKIDKINDGHYTVNSTLRSPINCFSARKFGETIQRIEKQTKIEIFK